MIFAMYDFYSKINTATKENESGNTNDSKNIIKAKDEHSMN